MNNSLRSILAVSLLMVASVASATYCQDNSPIGDHVNDDCHAPFKDPTKNPSGGNSTTSTSTAGSLAAAASRSAAAARASGGRVGNVTSTSQGGKATGGNARQGQQQEQAQEQVNQQGVNVTIDQSSHSTGANTESRGQSIIIPPGLPPLPGGVSLPSSNIAVLPGRACGPRQMIIKTAIEGREYGWNGEGASMVIGYRDTAVPITDGNGIPLEPHIDYENGVGVGSLKSSAWSKIGVSVNNAVGISLYHKLTGVSGQVASGGQIEIMVRDDVIEDCFFALPQKIIRPPAEIRYVNVPGKTRYIYRDRPVATPCCQPIVPVCCTKQ